MKLKELGSVLYSVCGHVQFATLWSTVTGDDIITGCSIDYAVKNYPEVEVRRIVADDFTLILEIAE